MRLTRWAFALPSLALAAAIAAAPASAEDFYKGKTINIVVGFSSGGGYDTYARLLARHFPKHIPGQPTIIVQNMPGAASLKSVQHLDAAAPKDGTVITAFNPGLITQSMTIPNKIRVKFTDVAWLGSMGEDLRVCYTWGATGIKTWDELVKAPQFILGDTGAGSSSYVNQRMVKDIFGVKVKQVLGYPGSAEKRLAIERGELQGDCSSWTSLPDDWIRDNKINVVLRFSEHVSVGLPESVPYGKALLKDPKMRQVYDVLTAPSEIGRPYILSKAVPADRIKLLRTAFDATLKDKALLADADKQRLIVSPLDGAKVEAMLKEIYSAPPEVVASAKDISGDN
jgi:tripartite-type tricarboxylate transporter receptor subunit TctC